MPRGTSDDDPNQLYRRDVVKHLAAGGSVGVFAGLAGCGGDGGGDTTTTSTTTTTDGSGGGDTTEDETTEQTTTQGEPVVDEFVTKVVNLPEVIQFNIYNPTSQSGELNRVLFDPVAKHDPVNGEWLPFAASDWTLEGDILSIELSEEHSWHDGTPLRAKDLVGQWTIDINMGNPITDYVEEVRARGERTVEVDLKTDEANQQLLYQTALAGRAQAKYEVYEQHIQAFDDATTEEETKAVQKQLTERTIEEPVGTGPFEFESADAQRAVLTKYEDHPAADGINFSRYKFKYLPSNQKRWQALISDEIDGETHLGVSPEALGNRPDHVDLVKIPGHGGNSLVFQHEDTPFSDSRVRRAIAYIINGDLIARNTTNGNYSFVPRSFNTGMMPTDSRNYLPDDVYGGFTDYAMNDSPDTEEDRAAQLLRDAGFSKSGGTWMKPDGSEFAPEIKTVSAWWPVEGQTITSQLKNFGIAATMVGREVGTFWGEDWPNGDFEICIAGFGGNHPQQSLSYLFETSPGNNPITHAPNVYEVPMPIGDPEGSTEEVDVGQLLTEVKTTRDQQRAKELVQKASWVFNRTLPMLPLEIGFGMSFLTNDQWTYPSTDADVMQITYPIYWLPRVGELDAKTE
jgi:peptide/nickel transport system substrate-binding protein